MATPEEMEATMIANLAEKTGRSLAEWCQVLAASGLEKHGQLVALLKSEHGVGHGYANLVAITFRRGGSSVPPPADDLLEEQYRGGKEGLRPLYEAIVAAVGRFGPDVEVSVKKTYVSLRRSKQFGIVQASTKSRLDVGLNLPGVAPAGRLEAAGSFNAMVSHRVRLSALQEADAELLGWLRQAYERA